MKAIIQSTEETISNLRQSIRYMADERKNIDERIVRETVKVSELERDLERLKKDDVNTLHKRPVENGCNVGKGI